MACLECDAPGHYTDTGCCPRCNRECLGIEKPVHQPGYCKGYECGRLATANDNYCYDCQDELDSYYNDCDGAYDYED